MPMKKNYYYLYTLNDMDPGSPGLIELNSLFPDKNSIYRDVIFYLDQQSFDVSKATVARLIEYAGSQINNGHNKNR